MVLIVRQTHPISGAVAVEPIDWSKATAAQKIFENIKTSTKADEAPVDFLMVAGDGRDDETVFRWANDLGESDSVKNVTTVSLGSRDTQAMKTLTQGVTGTSSRSCASGKSRIVVLLTSLARTGVLTVLQKLSMLS